MRRLFGTNLWMSGTLAATAALALGFAGCQGETEGGIEGSTCVSTQEKFAVTYFKLIKTKCGACHSRGSIGAVGSDFDLAPSSEAGFLDANMESVRKVANLVDQGTGKSTFLEKPLGHLSHGGGTIFDSEEDPDYITLTNLVQSIQEGDSCPNTEARFLAGTQLLGEKATFRKAALVLAARLPTDEELAAIDAGGWAAVDKLLDGLLNEEAFYDRLKDRYNDVMLTDFYMNDNNANVIGDTDTYNLEWYADDAFLNDPANQLKYGAANRDDLENKLRSWTIRGVARQNLELLEHVVKNNKPYSEVVTANYMVVNPFSARAYKIPAKDLKFKNDADPNEFIEVQLGGYEAGFPHAGMLTDPIWLSRHPTTQTNRNRHRAKEVLYLFLGNDILKAAERPIAINANALADNPTLTNPDCSVCHAVVDPIAGTFRNFQPTFDNGNDSQFALQAGDKWFEGMAQTGFGGNPAPATAYPKATQWLGQQIANDPGFAFAAVFMGYRTITGNEPLQPPTSGEEENFDAKLTAFLGQYYTFSQIANHFREGGYNYKSMMKELVMTPYFRAENTAPDIDPGQLNNLTGVGTAHFLTPEQMNRKLERVVGLRWTEDDGFTGRANLLSDGNREGYRILFGGIDSENTTQRITDPSGIMANVVERMGLEVGCQLVNGEMSLPVEQRRWLKNSSMTTEPKDANGYEVPEAVKAIKSDIQFLHEKLLGEKLDITDPEIDRSYKLFVSVWENGKSNVVPSGIDGAGSFPGECQLGFNYQTGAALPDEQILRDDSLYTGRAWAAVMAYMLTDFNFVYE